MAKPKYNFSPRQRFGKLVIVRDGGIVKFGRLQQSFWCKCDCGREELFAKNKLIRKAHDNLGCSVCVRGPCIVCGSPIPDERPKSNTCCDTCEQEKKRATQLKSYARRSQSPGFNQRRYEMQKARLELSPEKREAQLNRRRERVKTDSQLEKQRDYYRSYYARFRDEIIRSRRAFFNSLSPEEKEQRKENARRYDREYKRRYRDWLIENPVEHEKFLEAQREYNIGRQRKLALAELMRDSQNILDKGKK